MHEGPHTKQQVLSEAMQVLCIAALLLSAVAAQPDSWRPWQDEKFPPAGGRRLDADSERGDDEQAVTRAPEGGDGGTGGDWPEWDSGHPVWLHEMPPWSPDRRSGNGNPRRPVKETDRNNRQPGRPSQVSARDKRQVPGFPSDESGVPPPELGRQVGRHRGGKRPNRKNPGARVFSPVFKVDNVTLQNVTDITLKEGENLFLSLKHRGRGPQNHRGGSQGPPKNMQYVKLFYNATQPNEVSIEFGVVKPNNPGNFLGEEDDREDY